MFGKTKIPVQASLMIGTNKSLKSIKAEIILTFVAELFDDYYKLKNNSCEKLGVISIDTKTEDDFVIEKTVNELSNYCKTNVVRKEQLLKIFQEANSDSKKMLLAKQCEPIGVYYEKLAKLLMHYIPNGGLFIPEYFGILLIYYFKSELQQSFYPFAYIEEYNFDSILGVYEKINITLKKDMVKDNPNMRLWECRTTLDEMEKVALHLLKEYNSFQYKINIMRKSKTRRNKR